MVNKQSVMVAVAKVVGALGFEDGSKVDEDGSINFVAASPDLRGYDLLNHVRKPEFKAGMIELADALEVRGELVSDWETPIIAIGVMIQSTRDSLVDRVIDSLAQSIGYENLEAIQEERDKNNVLPMIQLAGLMQRAAQEGGELYNLDLALIVFMDILTPYYFGSPSVFYIQYMRSVRNMVEKMEARKMFSNLMSAFEGESDEEEQLPESVMFGPDSSVLH